MYQYDDLTAAATLPTPAAPGTADYFTDGSPGSGTPATILRSDFTNMLMLELLNVVEVAGLTPSKTTYTQVLSVIRILTQQEMYPSIGASVASNALTGSLAAPATLVFRNPTLSNGARSSEPLRPT